MHEIVLPAGETPKKLEKFLTRNFPIGYVRKVFRKNGVRINGQRAKSDDLIRAGDRIQLYIPFERDTAATKPVKSFPKIDVVFENDALLLINKPAGLAVHEGRTVSKPHSVLGILETQYRDRGIKPQLVHRLDKDTSGLLLVAKNQQTASELESCFETDNVDKEYLCLVAGRLQTNEGKIDFPLPGRDQAGPRAHPLSSLEAIFRSHARTRGDRDRQAASDPVTLRKARISGSDGRPARRLRFQQTISERIWLEAAVSSRGEIETQLRRQTARMDSAAGKRVRRDPASVVRREVLAASFTATICRMR